MFNPDNIRTIYYKKYEELVNLLKKSGPTEKKYLELRSILMFFSEKQDTMNDEELKLLKNVRIISDSILNCAFPNKKIYRDQKEECKELCALIKSKNLPE